MGRFLDELVGKLVVESGKLALGELFGILVICFFVFIPVSLLFSFFLQAFYEDETKADDAGGNLAFLLVFGAGIYLWVISG